jgi:uncharacterized protein involved in exopolysaccharide biosynthesis
MQEGKRTVPDDEIDMRSLGDRIVRIIALPYRLLLRRWYVTLVFVVLGVLLAVLIKVTSPRSYKSSFIIKPNDPKEKLHIRIFGDLQVLLKERNYGELSRVLQVDSNVIRTIRSVRLDNPFLKHPADSLNATEITLICTDPSVFFILQDAMLGYLERSPFFSMVGKLQREQIAFELSQTDADIRRLDSLKALQLLRYEKSLPSQSSDLLVALMNPVAAYTVSTEKMNRRSTLMARKAFSNNFQLIKSCVRVRHHYWPPRILFLCLWTVPISLVICFIFLFFRERPKPGAPAG